MFETGKQNSFPLLPEGTDFLVKEIIFHTHARRKMLREIRDRRIHPSQWKTNVTPQDPSPSYISPLGVSPSCATPAARRALGPTRGRFPAGARSGTAHTKPGTTRPHSARSGGAKPRDRGDAGGAEPSPPHWASRRVSPSAPNRPRSPRGAPQPGRTVPLARPLPADGPRGLGRPEAWRAAAPHPGRSLRPPLQDAERFPSFLPAEPRAAPPLLASRPPPPLTSRLSTLTGERGSRIIDSSFLWRPSSIPAAAAESGACGARGAADIFPACSCWLILRRRAASPRRRGGGEGGDCAGSPRGRGLARRRGRAWAGGREPRAALRGGAAPRPPGHEGRWEAAAAPPGGGEGEGERERFPPRPRLSCPLGASPRRGPAHRPPPAAGRAIAPAGRELGREGGEQQPPRSGSRSSVSCDPRWRRLRGLRLTAPPLSLLGRPGALSPCRARSALLPPPRPPPARPGPVRREAASLTHKAPLRDSGRIARRSLSARL